MVKGIDMGCLHLHHPGVAAVYKGRRKQGLPVERLSLKYGHSYLQSLVSSCRIDECRIKGLVKDLVDALARSSKGINSYEFHFLFPSVGLCNIICTDSHPVIVGYDCVYMRSDAKDGTESFRSRIIRPSCIGRTYYIYTRVILKAGHEAFMPFPSWSRAVESHQLNDISLASEAVSDIFPY